MAGAEGGRVRHVHAAHQGAVYREGEGGGVRRGGGEVLRGADAGDCQGGEEGLRRDGEVVRSKRVVGFALMGSFSLMVVQRICNRLPSWDQYEIAVIMLQS